MRKIIALGIMLLFLGMTISSSTGLNAERQSIKPLSSGNTLYVGGNGTGNYSKIQDAIDDASDGYTVYVYDDSSPYYENVIVDKPITLKGENKETTVINGSGCEIVVNISSDNVILSDFTVQNNYVNDHNASRATLIYIKSDYNIITNNIFKENGGSNGIVGYFCNYTSISNNYISVESSGIYLHFANNNKIVGNTIKYCFHGITLGATSNNYIYGNVITNNNFSGISTIFISANNTITMNDISYNEAFGIMIWNSHNDKIIQNNFIKNRRNAYFFHSQLLILLFTKDMGSKPFIPKILWDENYWDKWIGFGPKLILGRRGLLGNIPWINLDRNPAQEPYDI